MNTLDELIKEIEGEEQGKMKTANNENVDSLSDAVLQRSLEKLAAISNGKKNGFRNQQAEISPEEMLEKSGGKITDKELAELQEVLTENQKEKVAYVVKTMNENGNENKAKLFEKMASFALAVNPKVVKDYNFQKYETLDGRPKPMEMFFDEIGEVVNTVN